MALVTALMIQFVFKGCWNLMKGVNWILKESGQNKSSSWWPQSSILNLQWEKQPVLSSTALAITKWKYWISKVGTTCKVPVPDFLQNFLPTQSLRSGFLQYHDMWTAHNFQWQLFNSLNNIWKISAKFYWCWCWDRWWWWLCRVDAG